MNNTAPVGATDFDLVDRGRNAKERILPQRESNEIQPITIRRAIWNKLSQSNKQQQQQCLNCKRIDFHKIFDNGVHDSTGIPHSTLFDAVRNRDCSFCQTICHRAMEKFGPMKRQAQKETLVTIHHEYGWIGHARLERRELHTEPRIEVRMQHKCDSGASCHTGGLSVIEKFRLERYEAEVSLKRDERPTTLVRRAMDYKFDPQQLLHWLERSNKVAHRASKAPRPLDVLLRDRRLRMIDAWTGEIVTLRTPLRYAALSYVWGRSRQNHPSTVVKRDSVTDIRQTHVDLKTLPSNIRDALSLVKSINIRYLWVDKICIHQDDDDDKAAVVSEMSAVYGNAYITIIAADGSSADRRISRLAGKDTPENAMSFDSRSRPISLLPAPPGMEDALEQSEWSTRGWTLQERLLSRRCVIFTKSGVFFESEPFSESEAYAIKPSVLHESANGHNYGESIYNRFLHTAEWDLETYSYAVREYTSRDLTRAGDRLDAFMGIMRQRSPQNLPLHHLNALSGLPINAFIRSLFWSARDSQQKLTRRLHTDERKSRLLPSWSWVGWTGAVEIPTDWKPTQSDQVDIVDAANIVLNKDEPSMDSRLNLCKVMKKLRVMLHLLADTWTCTFKPSQTGDHRTYTVHAKVLKHLREKSRLPLDITPLDIRPDEGDYEDLRATRPFPLHPQFEPVWPEIVLPDGVDHEAKFVLLALPNVHDRVLIIQRLDRFYERVGIVKDWHINRAAKRAKRKYVRLG